MAQVYRAYAGALPWRGYHRLRSVLGQFAALLQLVLNTPGAKPLSETKRNLPPATGTIRHWLKVYHKGEICSEFLIQHGREVDAGASR